MATPMSSLGVQRAARRHAIVRHLSAVETPGSASVVASDKTGTLTRNEMTVRVAVTASGRVRFEGTGYGPEGSVEREGGGGLEGALRAELWRALAAADRANNAVLQEKDGRDHARGAPPGELVPPSLVGEQQRADGPDHGSLGRPLVAGKSLSLGWRASHSSRRAIVTARFWPDCVSIAHTSTTC